MTPIPKSDYGGRLREEPQTFGFWRDIASECVATFLFIVLSTILRAKYSEGNLLDLGVGIAFLWIAIGYGLADFGGCHMNSIITLAMMIRSEIIVIKAVLYWIFQTVAAICGFYYAKQLGHTPDFDTTLEWWKFLMLEGVAAMVICLAALGTGNIPRKGYIILQSIPVGVAVGMATIAIYVDTKACLNPTQALGYMLMMTIDGKSPDWSNHWYFWAGPVLGAALAGCFYWLFDVIEKPTVAGIYNTWTYGDAKRGAKNLSRENLTAINDDYRGREPAHHGYNRY